jgi:hypothetical protein
MEIQSLEKSIQIRQNEQLTKNYINLLTVLEALKDRLLPEDMIVSINQEIEELYHFKGSDKEVNKQLKNARAAILKLVEKELKLVPKNYYRNLWMAIGMSAFGMPIGIALSVALDNFAFIAIGLPIGMPIGMAVGSAMDKRAEEEGRQLDIEFEL